MWFFFNLVYYIDLYMSNHPCDSGINSAWSWCIVPFYVRLTLVCSYIAENFCIYIHQTYCPVMSFFVVVFLSGFCIKVTVACRMHLGVFLPLQLFEIALEGSLYVFLYMFGRIPRWSCLVLNFCLLGFFKKKLDSISLLVICSNYLSLLYFSLGRL